jgi:hypothetical protein
MTNRPLLLRRIYLKISFACILLFVTVLLLEVSLRFVPALLPQPQRSVLEEAQRIPLSNTRTYYGTGILLPQVEKADVVFIGDSFPFGTYVLDEDRFPTLYGKKTNQQVVNLGVGSQSPPRYNRMVEVSARYQPKHLFYCIFANDFRVDELSPDMIGLSKERAFQRFPTDEGSFIERTSFKDKLYIFRKWFSNLFVSFQLYKLFSQPLQVTNFQQKECTIDGHYYSFVTKEFWDNELSYDSTKVQLSVTRIVELVEAAASYCSAMETTLQVVLLPSKEMVYAPFAPKDVTLSIYDESHNRTYEVLSQQLAEKNIPSWDLTPILREAAAKGEKLYFSIDGHFNEAGHRVTAEALARRFPFQLPN